MNQCLYNLSTGRMNEYTLNEMHGKEDLFDYNPDTNLMICKIVFFLAKYSGTNAKQLK